MKFKSNSVLVLLLLATSAMASPDVTSGYAGEGGNDSNDTQNIHVVPLDEKGTPTSYADAKFISYKVCEIENPSACSLDIGTYDKAYVEKVSTEVREEAQQQLHQALKAGRKNGVVGAAGGAAIGLICGAIIIMGGPPTWAIAGVIGLGAAAGGASGFVYGGSRQLLVGKNDAERYVGSLQGQNVVIKEDILDIANDMKLMLKTGHLPVNAELLD